MSCPGRGDGSGTRLPQVSGRPLLALQWSACWWYPRVSRRAREAHRFLLMIFVNIIDGFANITLKDGVYRTFFKNLSMVYQQPLSREHFRESACFVCRVSSHQWV